MPGTAGKAKADHYIYDPRDVSVASLQVEIDPESLVDQREVCSSRGKQLVYHTAPFEHDTEVSGFFKLSAWIALDQPDTDFLAAVYEIPPDGSSVRLTTDLLRARYREGLRKAHLVAKNEALRYEFDHFTFVSRLVRRGSRLRLVLGPNNSINSEKNYNTGGVVAEESMKDARTVTVKLYHDAARPSALYVPIAGSQEDKR